MEHRFNIQEAKAFLLAREAKEKQQQEIERQKMLENVTALLKEKFAGSGVSVYLVGSLLQPYHFRESSDIDIVVKNFHGDRFELWTELETLLQKDVEVIRFESCHFQEFVLSHGLQVV